MRAQHAALRATVLPLIVSAIVLSSATLVGAQDTDRRKQVLLLFTHQSDQPAQIIAERAIRSTLQSGSSAPVELYSEYLDAVRAPLEGYEAELIVQLQRKYARKKFDLTLVVNPPALKFFLRNRTSLFSDSPGVFIVLDQRNLDGLEIGSNVTGVWAESSYKSNLELALQLHPATKRVVVISGVSEWDTYWRTSVREDFHTLEGTLEFTYLIGLSIAEQKLALAGMPENSLVYFVSSIQDNAGNTYGNLEVLREISPASNAPVYGSTDAHLGLGIVGGRLISFEALGAAGAQLGLRLLRGERPEEIAPHGIPNVPMFDARQLTRWGISEKRLPLGSVVRFKDPSVWELYRGRIVIALTLLALQSIFIALLLVERKRRRRAKEALDHLNAELEQRIAARTAALDAKSKELEAFAYSVAHDLKAPLRGIKGYTRLLLEEHKRSLNKEGLNFLDIIRHSTEEMTQLIEELLDYSRLERSELKSNLIELRPIVEAAVQQKLQEAGDRDIEVVVDLNGASVIADVNGLSQALKNYLDNAIKFTRNVACPKIEVGSKETTNACLIWVRDNGVGFDMKYHDRIFQIFQRLHSGDDYPGAGLGLAIVHKAMERMGGRAWGESEPGKGAIFYLEIPKSSRL